MSDLNIEVTPFFRIKSPVQDGVAGGPSGTHHLRLRGKYKYGPVFFRLIIHLLFPGGLVPAARSPASPLPRDGQERGGRVRVLRPLHLSERSLLSLQTREGRQDHRLQTLAPGAV